jgi:hypothetical protein
MGQLEAAALMKAQVKNATMPDTPAVTKDLYLEIESPEQEKSWHVPVHVKDLSAVGVILEVVDLPRGLKGESLLHLEGILHMVPDGLTKETKLRSKVVWIRQGELGPTHYLLGLDLGEVDFRARRSLEKLIARPKDISDLWTYWDQVQPKPATDNHSIIFYVGIGAFLGGMGLKFALPDSYTQLAMTLTLTGIYVIAGKCLWNWWRGRSIPEKV